MNALDVRARHRPARAAICVSLGTATILVLASAWIETITVLHEALLVLTG